MSEEGVKRLVGFNSFLWCLVDVVEMTLMDLESVMKKETGRGMKHELKRQYGIALKAIRRITEEVGRCSGQTQCEFGDDADVMNVMLRMLVSRYGDNHEKAYEIYRIMEKMEEKMWLPVDKRAAFTDKTEEDGECEID